MYTDGAVWDIRKLCSDTSSSGDIRQREWTYVRGTSSSSNKSRVRRIQSGRGRVKIICDKNFLMSLGLVIRSRTSHPPQANWTRALIKSCPLTGLFTVLTEVVFSPRNNQSSFIQFGTRKINTKRPCHFIVLGDTQVLQTRYQL